MDNERTALYGAILGDMIGAPYEFDRGDKTKNFDLFGPGKSVHYTDDTAMTLAIAKAVMDAGADAGEVAMKSAFVTWMQDFGRRYADGEYGGRFAGWLWQTNPQPYGSFGNGSAIPCGMVLRHFGTHARGGPLVCGSDTQSSRGRQGSGVGGSGHFPPAKRRR